MNEQSKPQVSLLVKAWMPIIEGLERRQLMAAGTVQTLPFRLDFNKSVSGSILDKDGQGTGFTRVQGNKRGDQYQAGAIDLDLTTGRLRLTSVGSKSAGLNSGVDNSLINALETQFDGNQSGFVIETRLIGPLSNLNTRIEQAGIYFGADQDNFVKLVVGRNLNGQFLSFEDEFTNATGGVSSTRNGTNAQTNIGSFASISTLDLRLVGDAATGKMTAYYRVNSDNGAYTKVAFDITIAPEKRSTFFNSASRAGLLAAHKNSAGAITATFDYFSITGGTAIVSRPSVSGLVDIASNALNVSRNTQVRATVSWPTRGRAINMATLSSSSVRLYQASSGATVNALLSVSSDGKAIQLTPTSQLDPSTTYTFEVKSTLKDSSGATFQPFVSSFTTAADSQVSNISVSNSALYFSDIWTWGNNGSGSSFTQTVRVTNTGVASLSITSLVFGGTNGSEFSLASSVTTPLSIEPGASVDIPVRFTATQVGIRAGTLTINSNDPDSPATVVTLRGLGTAGQGGDLEPSLQRIFDLYQIPVNVGDSTPDTTDIPSPPTSGDALNIERLRAAGAGAVTIEMLGHFANSVSPSSRFGYYTPGSIADRKQLFTVAQAYAQTIRPLVNGNLSFTPTGDFGLYAEFPAFSNRIVTSEKAFNTWDSNTSRQQKVRFYPLKNADGSTVPNAYVFTFEEYEVAFDQNDIVGIIRNVIPVAAGPELGVINTDGAPFPDRLVFNRIRDTQAYDPVNNYIPNTVKERATLRLTNSGNQDLVVSGVSINSSDFVIESGGGVFTLTPGQSRDIVVKFVYNRTGLGNEIRNATLTVNSNDADEGTKTVQLAGLWQSHSENAPNGVSQEPTALTILQTFGYNVNLGNVQTGGSNVRAGEEVLSSAWFRVDEGKPVGVRMLAAFHQQRSTTNSNIRWLEEGGTQAGYFIFKHLASDGQSLLPRKDNSSDPAYGEFTPWNTAFIWRVDSHWSEDGRNLNSVNPSVFPYADGGHAMRFYAAKDRSGNLIPDTYIMIHDYTGQSFSNYDYQDNIYLITNVRPKLGPTSPSNLITFANGSGINLAWSANTEGNLAGYNLYRSTSANGTFTKVNSDIITGTSYNDSSALTGVTYYYQLRAIDVHGTEGSNATASSTRTSDTAAPATPANPTSVSSTGSIALNWLNNTEADLAGYNVYRAASPDGPWVKLNSSLLSNSDYTDLSAPVAAFSYYRITAVDFTGNESSPALTDNYRPASGAVPTAPSNLRSTQTTANSVTLAWNDNSNNETGFLIERQNSDGSWTQIGTAGANATSFPVTGLQSGTTYAFRVRAQNASGPSAYSNTFSVTTTLTAPAAASGLSATALNATAVRLTWQDNSSNEVGYRIERQTGSGAWATIDSVGTNVTLYVDYSALPSTTYNYRVVAYNSAGSASASNTASMTTPTATGDTSSDIGNPTPAGSTNTIVDGRDYDITAGGTDIWANSDQFRFVYRQLTGDFDYSARVTDISQVDVGSMAGLMARESLNADSRHVYMRARSSGMRFNYREATGGVSNGQGNVTFSFPNAWVRLQRVGNVFTGFASTDGTNWTQVYQMTMNLPSTLYFGMAVSARTTTGQATLAKIRDLTDQKVAVAPTAPKDLIGTSDTTGGRVLLYWTNTAQNASSYRVDRRELGSETWTAMPTLGPTANQYIDTGVTLGRSYVYRVVAINAAGSSESNEVVITHAAGVPTAPTSLATSTDGDGIILNWQDNASNETYYQVERRTGSGGWVSIALVDANRTTYTDKAISANTDYAYRVRALGTAGDSNYSNESEITSPAALALTSTDIGTTGGSTQVVETGSDYNVSAAGTDIWSTSDQFRFVHRQITGDFDMRVRVESLGFTNAQSMAGLMARATLDGNSRNVFVKARADGSDRMTYRSSTGGSTVGAGSGTVSFPNAWLRMTRVGNTFTTYASNDGASWTVVSSVTLSLPATMYVGMAVSSRQTGVSTTAAFRDFSLTTA